jgi:exosome complex exonuclease RRP6
VDLEYISVAYSPTEACDALSLIQISTCSSDYIFDCFSLRETIRTESDGLKAIFGDFGVVKVFHGSDSDLKYLEADLGVTTTNVFDTARGLSFI